MRDKTPFAHSFAMALGVLTLNLWNINEPLVARYAALESGLKRLRPDIVCLQEADRDPRSGRSQAEIVANMCGHTHVLADSELAIVCSLPVIGSGSVPLPTFAGDFPRRALSAKLSVNGRPLIVTNTHLAYPPELIQERKKQAESLLAAIRRHRASGAQTAKILCGDFNDTADSPAVHAVLDSEEGFQDVFAACFPDSPGTTYACRNRYVDASSTVDQRIDYIFATRDLEIRDCSVVFDGNDGFDLASDHFGVFCRLALLPTLSRIAR
jgi:endonuclease/exonuclease/phosphatase family metal-dependent hydrolase